MSPVAYGPLQRAATEKAAKILGAEAAKTPSMLRSMGRTGTPTSLSTCYAEGERPLPQTGLLYFPYGGKVTGIRSLELIYSGTAGKAKLDLQ